MSQSTVIQIAEVLHRTPGPLVLACGFMIVVGITFGYLTFFPSELDLWVDEKDERIWLLTPATLIALPAAAQYFFWEKVRLPFGATLLVLALMTGEWLTRYSNMWGWTLFPLNMVWVSIVIPGAVLLDVLLLWTRSYIITGVLGSLVWGLIFYPVNWAILARFRQPVEYNGMLMALADVIGYQNVRSNVIPGTSSFVALTDDSPFNTAAESIMDVNSIPELREELLMDPTIVAAVIGAVATVTAAFIGRISGKKRGIKEGGWQVCRKHSSGTGRSTRLQSEPSLRR